MKNLRQPPSSPVLAFVAVLAMVEAAALLAVVVWQAQILERQRAVIRDLACQIYRCI